MLIVDPWAWAFLRTLSGFSIAGCFTVIEAWLQAKVSNRNRALGSIESWISPRAGWPSF